MPKFQDIHDLYGCVANARHDRNKLDGKTYGVLFSEKDDTLRDPGEYIVFLARDELLVPTLVHYNDLCREAGCDEAQIAAMQDLIARVNQWQQAHDTKLPDVEPGELSWERPAQLVKEEGGELLAADEAEPIPKQGKKKGCRKHWVVKAWPGEPFQTKARYWDGRDWTENLEDALVYDEGAELVISPLLHPKLRYFRLVPVQQRTIIRLEEL